MKPITSVALVVFCTCFASVAGGQNQDRLGITGNRRKAAEDTITTVTIITFDAPNEPYTYPVALNERGQVVVRASSVPSLPDAGDSFLRNPNGTFTYLNYESDLGIWATAATSINERGQIAGYVRQINFSNLCEAIVRQPDGTIDFLMLSGSTSAGATSAIAFPPNAAPCQEGSNAVAINRRGAITGLLGGPPFLAVLWNADNTSEEFNIFPEDGSSPYTQPLAINESGQIAGFYINATYPQTDFRSFLRERDGSIITFTVPDSTVTYAIGVNATGKIAGYYGDAHGTSHGFLRMRDGKIVQFDVPNSSGTTVTAINDRGQVVGYYGDANGASHGFLRERDGSIVQFDVPNSSSTNPSAMNNKGQITGWYTDANGIHGFLRCGEKGHSLQSNSARERLCQ